MSRRTRSWRKRACARASSACRAGTYSSSRTRSTATGGAAATRSRARVAVEQAATLGWDRYAGLSGKIIGMHTFGASAPLKALLAKFGFTPEGVVKAAREQIAQQKQTKEAAD